MTLGNTDRWISSWPINGRREKKVCSADIDLFKLGLNLNCMDTMII